MSERIPQRIDHYRYTDKGVFLEGIIKQQDLENDLPRLYDAIVDTAGDVEYLLQFDVDASSNRIVTGSVKTKVILQCQRCMNDYEAILDCEIATAFVQNAYDLKKADSSDYDTFLVSENRKELLDPRIIIEDELLLNLPQIPKHPLLGSETEINCQVQFDYPVAEENEKSKTSSGQGNKQKDEQKGDNPFAILKDLKQLKEGL